jgi:hypothetical protein
MLPLFSFYPGKPLLVFVPTETRKANNNNIVSVNPSQYQQRKPVPNPKSRG